jgi:DNA-binding transcriptional ArsR family regulator
MRQDDEDALWRALANPLRRRLLDLLREGPQTTGALAAAVTSVSRFAVMQHLAVLSDVGLVVVRPQGRRRLNYLNPVPLQRFHERWVSRMAAASAAELLALERVVAEKGAPVQTLDELRTVRLEAELRLRATPERVFQVMTEETLSWFPHTYGEERTKAIVFEPRVGGAVYEDWGSGSGHLYGLVTVYDPPSSCSMRTRLMPGSTMDTSYSLTQDGDEIVLAVSRVAVGPFTDEDIAGIRAYGDIAKFEDAIRAAVEAA